MSELPGSSSQFTDMRAGVVGMRCYAPGCDWETVEQINDSHAAALGKTVKDFRKHHADKHGRK